MYGWSKGDVSYLIIFTTYPNKTTTYLLAIEKEKTLIYTEKRFKRVYKRADAGFPAAGAPCFHSGRRKAAMAGTV